MVSDSTFARSTLLGIALLATACPRVTAGADGAEGTDASSPADVPQAPLSAVDLLFVIHNADSPATQTALITQLPAALSTLIDPPDRDGDGRPDAPPVRDLHVGVISTDLGTPGSTLRRCDNSDLGDDGRLNPIRYGPAMQRHSPWRTAPDGFRPSDCNDEGQFPAFLAFTSGATPVAQLAHDIHCNAALWIDGCETVQSLEAIWRALLFHRADDRSGNTSPHAGFVRENAVLAIVVLSGEEDESARDCRYAEDPASCQDASSVFDITSTQWSAGPYGLRFYMYRPCTAQDPTWPLERYFDPRNPLRGYLALKPGHPERVIFTAIAGVPLRVPMLGAGAAATIDWNGLLGPPGTGGLDDYCSRQGDLAFSDPRSLEGPISMRQADPDPNCEGRPMAACRGEGTRYDTANPACYIGQQFFAWPSRRIAEIARRFDESPVCGGHACRNGFVSSICASDYGSAMAGVVARIQRRLAP